MIYLMICRTCVSLPSPLPIENAARLSRTPRCIVAVTFGDQERRCWMVFRRRWLIKNAAVGLDYGTEHLIRNRTLVPGRISYSKKGAFHTNSSILPSDFLIFLLLSACFLILIARFLIGVPCCIAAITV